MTDFENKIFDIITDCAKEADGDIYKTNELLWSKCDTYKQGHSNLGKFEGEALVSASAHFSRYIHTPSYNSIDKIVEAIKKERTGMKIA